MATETAHDQTTLSSYLRGQIFWQIENDKEKKYIETITLFNRNASKISKDVPGPYLRDLFPDKNTNAIPPGPQYSVHMD